MLAVESVIERLKKYLNVTTDAQLARLLGISAVTLSAWRYRNVFDIMKVYPLCPDVNWNWLFNGEGEMRYDFKKMAELRVQIENLNRKVDELESQNKILFKLVDKYVTREVVEELEPAVEEQIKEANNASIKKMDKTVAMLQFDKALGKVPEEERGTYESNI